MQGKHSTYRVGCSPWFQASEGSWKVSPADKEGPGARPCSGTACAPLVQQLPECVEEQWPVPATRLRCISLILIGILTVHHPTQMLAPKHVLFSFYNKSEQGG